ncbi:hypothetical protein GC207_12810 [bacterium]|nr:hypothetical protein [bacterium]
MRYFKRTLLAVMIAVSVATCVCLTIFRPPPSQALAVSFVGYTNLPSGYCEVAFTISNQSNITIERSPIVYVETHPFAPDNSFTAARLPTNWIMFFVGHQEMYLKPKATERVTLRIQPASGEWRLRVPWSSGVRARIHSTLQKFPYWRLPERLSVAPVYYATGDKVKE